MLEVMHAIRRAKSHKWYVCSLGQRGYDLDISEETASLWLYSLGFGHTHHQKGVYFNLMDTSAKMLYNTGVNFNQFVTVRYNNNYSK